MKNEKVIFQSFTIVQWEQEQAFLRQQHLNGWKFTKWTSPACYHFEKCEPEDVVYQIDYNPKGIAHKAEYVQMFRDCGWEYLQDHAGFTYFRKPASEMIGNEKIFCDDSSRMDFIKRIFQGRLIPLVVIFFLIIIPEIFFQSQLGTLSGKIFTGIFAMIGVVYFVSFLNFALHFWKYQKSFN